MNSDLAKSNRFVIMLGLMTAAAAISIDLSLPAIPSMVDALSTSLSRAQQIVGIFMIGMAVTRSCTTRTNSHATRGKTMRQRFYFFLSIFFWIVMAVGFSDNWLTDRDQPSNSDWRMLIHAFFAFSWFTLLVVQTGLIRQGNRQLHMKTGIAGMIVFAGFLITTVPHYIHQMMTTGGLAPLSTMIFAQLVVATALIVTAFAKRKTNSRLHKTNMMVGTFLLIQPAADRAIGHVFGRIGIEWLLLYVILFALFIWRHKGIRWQVGLAFVVWFSGLLYFMSSMGPGTA